MVELYPSAVDSDEDVVMESSSDEENDQALTVRKKKKVAGAGAEFSADFHFEGFGTSEDREADDLKKYLKKTVSSTLEEKIADERKRKNTSEKIQVANSGDDEIEQLGKDASDALKEKKKKGGKSKKADDFFEELAGKAADEDQLSFDQMNLSRPILKAIGAAGFTDPTPIQAACIPVALAGKDICACAATGTGKTGAFVLPILERLLFRPKQRSVTRVLVLVPTRELAIQVFQVFRKLSTFSQLDVCLCAGGLDIKAQEAALRNGPDVVVATPGRLLDHLHNAPSFSLATIEVLVLDEADRMLEQAFADQMNELIRLCATKRQTLLFSATMTDQIEELASMSLKKPVKIFINENTDTALRLRQEFIRIRGSREEDREPIVAALITRTFQEQTIVFVKTKKDCQRLQILLGLLGVKVGQLHGSLTQAQRIDALARFKKRQLDVLVSTDLASRGLDIEGVQTVMNMHMPASIKQYIHRVGRTARAGKAGRSISLVGEDDRKLLKEIVSSNAEKILKQRVVAVEVVEAYRQRVNELEDSVAKVEEEEKTDRAYRMAEEEMKRTEERLEKGKTERDGRKWFKTPNEAELLKKQAEKKKMKALEKKHKAKATVKTPEDKELDRMVAFQAREAKRARQGKRVRAIEDDDVGKKRGGAGGKFGKGKKLKKGVAKKSSFTSALASISKQGVKKARAGPEDPGFRSAKRNHMQGSKQKRS